MYEELTAQAKQAVTELLDAAKLKPGKIFVVGCSSSEMVGARIGKGSSLEAAQAAFAGIYPILQAQGVEILTCGTCLNHYGLTEKLQVGEVTNMYVIAEKMTQAKVVVKP